MRFLVGTIIFRKFFQFINKHFNDKILNQKVQNILKKSQHQRTLILNEAKCVLEEQVAQNLNNINRQIEQKQLDIQNRQAALKNQQSYVDKYAYKLESMEADLAKKTFLIETKQKELNSKILEFKNQKKIGETALVQHTRCKPSELFDDIKNTFVNNHILDLSRISFEMQTQLKQDAQKLANKILQSVYYRYQPHFVWPKISFLVNFNNQNLVEKYISETSPILKLLLKGTDSTINMMTAPKENQFIIKISGGLGVDKEVIRLTLEECSTKKILNPDKIQIIRNKHQKQIENQIFLMGVEAAKILKLNTVHPEILKLVGSLNFRTSHRQNQYYHSLEVAVLAGMIARELGVDENLAKRSGLLHDVGKVHDYKIEGSHAVISGDYATKYNENEDVVDTILAHHDDKIVDTPHAFILKAADAMSGARPGARVDMEDGYNRRMDGISAVVQSFQSEGVINSAIMHAGREVHVYVDNKKTPFIAIDSLAQNIAEKLENEVEYPGQIRVTIIRRMEITEVA